MNATKLLVSVRSAAEAQLAMQGSTGGALIIDIKEPSHGPLGRADAKTIAEIAQVVQATDGVQVTKGKTILSVAMGELAELEQLSMEQRTALLPTSVSYVKIGLAGEATTDNWQDRLAAMFKCFVHARPVPVAYWDAANVNAPSPDQTLDWAIKHAAAVFLIDTADKTAPGLFYKDDDLFHLTRLLKKAHAHGLPVALAGRLVGTSFSMAADLALAPYGPEIVGVRTAACEQQNREGVICPRAVGQLLKRLGAADASAVSKADVLID